MTEGLGRCGRYLGLKDWKKNALSSCVIVLNPDRKEVELKDIGWIHLAQDGDKCQVLKTAMKKKIGIRKMR